MKNRYAILVILILLGIILGAGTLFSEKCVDINGCKSCWKTIETTVTSALCSGNTTCIAQPADQQNNAIVDAVLCACDKAKASSYSDASSNRKIESTIYEFTQYNLTANNVCEQPGLFLAKRNYG